MPFTTTLTPLAEDDVYKDLYKTTKGTFYGVFLEEVASTEGLLRKHFYPPQPQPQLPTSKPSKDNPPTPQVIFRAYCNFLRRREWVYESSEDGNKDCLTRQEKRTINSYKEQGILLTPYMLRAKPKLNCYEATRGLVFALRAARIKKEDIQIVRLKAAEGSSLAFRGYKNTIHVLRIPYPHMPAVGEWLTWNNNTVGVRNDPVTQDVMGVPFENHYLVRCRGTYWDPTLGIAFAGPPEDIFEDCEMWYNGTANYTVSCRSDSKTWFAQFTSDDTRKRAQWRLRSRAEAALFFSDNTATQSIKIKGVDVAVPIDICAMIAAATTKIDKAFVDALKLCLRDAITAYEKRQTVLRISSAESRTYLIYIRRYLKMDAEPNKKKYTLRDGDAKQDAVESARWSDEDARREVWAIVNPANRARCPVGKALREAITAACNRRDRPEVMAGLQQP
jgi:hypothetical protein